jgi:hypothetical protein
MLLAGGMWGTIRLTYDETEVHDRKIRPFKEDAIRRLEPMNSIIWVRLMRQMLGHKDCGFAPQRRRVRRGTARFIRFLCALCVLYIRPSTLPMKNSH